MKEKDIVVIDTNPYKEISGIVEEKIRIFELVDESHLALRKVLPEFDFGNPLVDPNTFASSLVETCKENQGLGLSANQCGFEHRVFVMGSNDNYVAFFNPKIVSISEEMSKTEEGCLSFKGLFLNIERPKEIEVEYQDFNGIKRQAKFAGLTARCFQHELDHMNGIVYTMHVKPLAMQQAHKKRAKLAAERRKLQQLMIKKVKEKFNVKRF